MIGVADNWALTGSARMWKRIKNLFTGGDPRSGVRFVIHKRYQVDIPFPQYDAKRPFRILQYLRTHGLLKQGMLIRPRPVSLRRLQLVHDQGYLKSLGEPNSLKLILGLTLDSRTQDQFLCFQRLMCGGTLRAARSAVFRRSVMVNLGGGLHHAAAEQGSGFCAFNDVAVAIASLRQEGFAEPILVVDLDLHDGDGTRSIFAADPTVYTFSVHNNDLGGPAATASTSIALGPDMEGEAYLKTVREHLPRIFAEFKPGLVFYLAGSDPGVDDRLGNWRVSLEDMLRRDRLVMDLARPPADRLAHLPVVVLLAGGYGPTAWRHGAAFFSWLLSGRSDLHIPPEMELPVDMYRRLSRFQQNPHLFQDENAKHGTDDWGLQEEEFSGAGPRQNPLFLGLFSRHGLEMSLEELGLLNRLRNMGFGRLAVSIDLEDPQGHTLRIRTQDDPPLTIFELRLRIDRATAPGRSFLMVEWLLFQDARSSFEISRPLLPGQRYPGLGLLRDTAAVLIVACENLHLDGLAFTPSHFHLACLADPQSMFLDPGRQARFAALRRATANLRVAEAAAALREKQVIDEESGRPAAWEPGLMILPVSADMKTFFTTADYREQVQAAASAIHFRIA